MNDKIAIETISAKPIIYARCHRCGYGILTKAEEVFCPNCKLHIIPDPLECTHCKFIIKELANEILARAGHRDGK